MCVHIFVCVSIYVSTHIFKHWQYFFFKSPVNIVLLPTIFVSFTFFSYCFIMNFRPKSIAVFCTLKALLKLERTSSYSRLYSTYSWVSISFHSLYIDIFVISLFIHCKNHISHFFPYSENSVCTYTDLELLNCCEILCYQNEEIFSHLFLSLSELLN